MFLSYILMNCLKVLVCVPPHTPTLYPNCRDKMCLSVLFCAIPKSCIPTAKTKCASLSCSMYPNPVYQLQRQNVLFCPSPCTPILCTNCRDKNNCTSGLLPLPHASSASKDVEPQRSCIITGSGCVHPGWWW